MRKSFVLAVKAAVPVSKNRTLHRALRHDNILVVWNELNFEGCFRMTPEQIIEAFHSGDVHLILREAKRAAQMRKLLNRCVYDEKLGKMFAS
jgi:hypothetical protein